MGADQVRGDRPARVTLGVVCRVQVHGSHGLDEFTRIVRPIRADADCTPRRALPLAFTRALVNALDDLEISEVPMGTIRSRQ